MMRRHGTFFFFLITSILTLFSERLLTTSTSDGKKYHYFTICTWCTLTWQIYIIRISLRKELAKTTTLPTPRHKSITHNSTSSKKNIIHRFTGSSLHLHSYCPWVLDPWPMGAIRQWSWVHVTIRWDELRRARPPCSLPLSTSPLPFSLFLSSRQAQSFLSLSHSSFPLTVCGQHT